MDLFTCEAESPGSCVLQPGRNWPKVQRCLLPPPRRRWVLWRWTQYAPGNVSQFPPDYTTQHLTKQECQPFGRDIQPGAMWLTVVMATSYCSSCTQGLHCVRNVPEKTLQASRTDPYGNHSRSPLWHKFEHLIHLLMTSVNMLSDSNLIARLMSAGSFH
jgi:hypothetical protein